MGFFHGLWLNLWRTMGDNHLLGNLITMVVVVVDDRLVMSTGGDELIAYHNYRAVYFLMVY